jgi:hypothetical protein
MIKVSPMPLQITEREATSQDKWTYAVQWEQFARENMQDPNKAHTPLELLFVGEPSIIVTLKDNNIHSVEQCANFPTARWEKLNKLDANLGRELADYQRRSQEFLRRIEEALPFQEMHRQIADRGDTLKQLQIEMLQLENKLAEITKQQAPAGQRALYSEAKPVDIPDPRKAHLYDPQAQMIQGLARERLADLQRARGKRR